MTSIRSEFYRQIIERLIEARKQAGMTQAELGAKIGKRQTFVSKVELMERRLDVAEFIDFCEALGVDFTGVIRNAMGGN